MSSNKLVLRTEIQRKLFVHEITGQLSDGWWENTKPYHHWKNWCNCEVVKVSRIHPRVGRTFQTDKDRYDLLKLMTIDMVVDRMLEIGRSVLPEYTTKMLRADLREIKKAMATYTTNPCIVPSKLMSDEQSNEPGFERR